MEKQRSIKIGVRAAMKEQHHSTHPFCPLRVSPGGMPVQIPTENDVLYHIGQKANTHHGNIKFRKLVHLMGSKYNCLYQSQFNQAHIAARVVWAIRASDPPGRFLKQDEETGLWKEIGDKSAFRYARQCLGSCWESNPSNNDWKMYDKAMLNAVCDVRCD